MWKKRACACHAFSQDLGGMDPRGYTVYTRRLFIPSVKIAGIEGKLVTKGEVEICSCQTGTHLNMIHWYYMTIKGRPEIVVF